MVFTICGSPLCLWKSDCRREVENQRDSVTSVTRFFRTPTFLELYKIKILLYIYYIYNRPDYEEKEAKKTLSRLSRLSQCLVRFIGL